MTTEPWVSVDNVFKDLGVALDSVDRWPDREGGADAGDAPEASSGKVQR
jgi:hypothetical protein